MTLTIKKTITGRKFISFTFEEKPYTVKIDRISNKISCSCFNGSNMGVNNKQICKHKKFILDKYGGINERK